MSAVLAVVGSILAVIAAIVHGGFFLLESVFWNRPSTWRLFGIRDARDAEVLRPMAYNQGFYNAFLAVGAALAVLLLGTGLSVEGGFALALFTLASMLLAAVVLLTSNRRMLRGALVQGLPPALGLVFLLLAVLVD